MKFHVVGSYRENHWVEIDKIVEAEDEDEAREKVENLGHERIAQGLGDGQASWEIGPQILPGGN